MWRLHRADLEKRRKLNDDNRAAAAAAATADGRCDCASPLDDHSSPLSRTLTNLYSCLLFFFFFLQHILLHLGGLMSVAFLRCRMLRMGSVGAAVGTRSGERVLTELLQGFPVPQPQPQHTIRSQPQLQQPASSAMAAPPPAVRAQIAGAVAAAMLDPAAGAQAPTMPASAPLRPGLKLTLSRKRPHE